eukprot:2520766-Rhodomonas_salina.1
MGNFPCVPPTPCAACHVTHMARAPIRQPRAIRLQPSRLLALFARFESGTRRPPPRFESWEGADTRLDTCCTGTARSPPG